MLAISDRLITHTTSANRSVIHDSVCQPGETLISHSSTALTRTAIT
jgi:hypothetical protein